MFNLQCVCANPKHWMSRYKFKGRKLRWEPFEANTPISNLSMDINCVQKYLLHSLHSFHLHFFLKNNFVLNYGNRDNWTEITEESHFVTIVVWTTAMLKLLREGGSSGIFSNALLLELFHSPAYSRCQWSVTPHLSRNQTCLLLPFSGIKFRFFPSFSLMIRPERSVLVVLAIGKTILIFFF